MPNKAWIINAVLMVLTIGVAASQLKAQDTVPPNILLITVDSLRADHLGCYGYARNISPNIDALAQEGVVFDQAIAQSSWTIPSMLSIATSVYPSTHKIYTWDMALPPGFLTLGNLLKARGYYNFFCSGHNLTLAMRLNVNNSFDEYSYNVEVRSADKINPAALKFLRDNQKKKFFLWVHYMDTHDGFYRVRRDASLPLSASEFSDSINKYDAAIRGVDAQIREIVNELKSLKIYQNTLLIITADHGEEICEHGKCFNHAQYLWESLIRVPLIIVWADQIPASRKPDQVQLLDLAPTICDLLKIKPPASFEGHSFLPLLEGKTIPPRPAFSEDLVKERQVKEGKWLFKKSAVRIDQWKLIHNLSPQAETYELYDLKNDPGEFNNLWPAENEKFEWLKNELKLWQQREPPDKSGFGNKRF